MKDSFLKNIKDLDLFSKGDKLILLTSGGADSVSWLFIKRYWF